MSSYNRVTILGNLVADPELKKTRNGISVSDIRLALNRTWSDESGEKREEVTFVEITIWGRTAENVVKFLKKGRPLLVEGRLQNEAWTDASTGKSRTKLKILGESVQFVGAVPTSKTTA